MPSRYPSKRLPEPGGDFIVHQFIIPIRINRTILWGWLDTGANVSIIPKEIASQDLGLNVDDDADGAYDLATMIRVPYKTYSFDLEILEYIDGTMPMLHDVPYRFSGEAEIILEDLDFQVLTLSWKEIAQKLRPSPPLHSISVSMPWVILGSDSVLEQLHIEMDGYEEVFISPKTED